MLKFLSRLTDSNDREVRRFEPTVARINELEPEYAALTDADLRGKTEQFRARLRDALGDLLVPIEQRALTAEEEARLDFIAGSLVINNRSLVMVAMLLFDTKDAEQTRRAYDVAKRLAVEAGKRGYGEYRAHLDFMDLAAEQYGFGDRAYMRFVETIKDAVDPNGILSPGKQGIWPRSFREAREGA